MLLPASLLKVVSAECLCCPEHLQILTAGAVYTNLYRWHKRCLSNICYALQPTLTSKPFPASFKACSVLRVRC